MTAALFWEHVMLHLGQMCNKIPFFDIPQKYMIGF